MEKLIRINGREIFCRITGNGSPVVLLHGFGEDGDVWNQQIEFLKDRFQVIVPDLPGSGKSELIPDMSMEGMAAVIHQLLHSLKLEKVSLAGHSMGGYIVLAFAAAYPERLSAFGLVHSTAYGDIEEKVRTREKGIEFIQKNGASAFLRTSIPNLVSAKTMDERPELIDELLAGSNNFSDLSLVSYYQAMINRPDRRIVLKNTKLPVLFIMGKHDNAVPLKDVLEQSHLPEKAYIHILQDSGHMGMLEETRATNFFLSNFLSEIAIYSDRSDQ